MKKLFCYLFLLAGLSCSKIEIEEPAPVPKASTAEFVTDKEIVYMGEPVAVTVKDSTSDSKNYQFEFGDGQKSSGTYHTTHTYNRGGNFKITLKVDRKTHTKDIKVRPGYLSYQIQNNSSVTLDVLSYIDNYKTGTLLRDEYNPQKISDTMYVNHSATNLYLFGSSLFHKNKEYVPVADSAHLTYFEKHKHNVYTFTDTTEITPKSSYGQTDSIQYIIDFKE